MSTSKENLMTIMEVALEIQTQETENYDIPRAEYRQNVIDRATKLVYSGVITQHSEDIDEIIAKELGIIN